MSKPRSVALGAVLFIGLLTLLTAGPFWQQSGLPAATYDQQLHVHRMAAMERAFAQGVFWPRWFPAVYNGLGAPVFHHYSPGLYWLVAAVHQTGIGLAQALKLNVTAALLLSGLCAYAWLRYAFSPVASLVGAAFYLLHPHILTRSYYFEGSLSRLFALLLLPVCLYAFTALHMRQRLWNWATAVASLTSLVFIHPKVAMVGAAVLASYWIFLALGYRRPGGLMRCAMAAFLAALLSAGFWLPALADMDLVRIESAYVGRFDYRNHFLNFWQLISLPSLVMDSRAGNPLVPLHTLGFGAASWAVLLAGLVSLFLVSRRDRRNWGLAGALLALSLITLTLQPSEPLWEAVRGLRMVQFPFRFLSIAPLGIVPMAAATVDAWPISRRQLPALGILLASFLSLFPYLFPAHTSHWSNVQTESLTAEDTRTFEQAHRTWGTTWSGEFLLKGANMNVINGQVPEPNAAKPLWRSPHEAVVDLSGKTEPALVRLHFHPAWSAGARATLNPGPAGWLQVTSLNDPAQPLEIRWQGTVAQRWGERISLLGLLATLGGLLFLHVRRRPQGEVNEELKQSFTPGSDHIYALVGCLLVLVLVRYSLDLSIGGPFLRHSPPGELAFAVDGHPQTIGDPSSTQVKLLGWQLVNGPNPKPGGSIRVRLYWQGQGRINKKLHSFVHLYTPALKRSWAVENGDFSGRPDSWHWYPDKYYMDDLRLSLPADLPPAAFSLVAGMYDSEGERLDVPGASDGVLQLRTLEIAPTRPGLFQKERPSTVARAATNDGLRLQGYDLDPHPDAPALRLFWESGDGIDGDWITYIHLHDSHGARVAQFDGPAIAGLQPTSQWHANALYVDRRQLTLPAAFEPGNYLLRIGLYNRATGVRLPFQPHVNDESSFENGQLLVPLTVSPPMDASG